MPRKPFRVLALLVVGLAVLAACSDADGAGDGAERRAPDESSSSDPVDPSDASSSSDPVDPSTSVAAADPQALSARGGDKIRICHRTNSATNPYNLLEVSKNAVAGHTQHAEDVIPPFDEFPGQNWPSTILDENCELLEPPTSSSTTTTTTTLPPIESTTTLPPASTSEPPPETTVTPSSSVLPSSTTEPPATTTSDPTGGLESTTTIAATTTSTDGGVSPGGGDGGDGGDGLTELPNTGADVTLAVVGALLVLAGLALQQAGRRLGRA